MTLKKFQQLKEYIDKIVAQLEKEAFEEGVNTTSDEYLKGVEDIVRNVLLQKGVPYEKYIDFEKSIKDWDELGEGEVSFFPQLTKKLEETKLKERMDVIVDDFSKNLSQLKADVIGKATSEKEEIMDEVKGLTKKLEKRINELDEKVIRKDIRVDTENYELKSEIDALKKENIGITKTSKDLLSKVDKIKIPKPLDDKTIGKEVLRKFSDPLFQEGLNGKINRSVQEAIIEPTRRLGMGLQGQIDTKFTTSSFIDDETPTGTINGSNQTFTLTYTPSPATSLKVYVNGQRQVLTTDYTLSGSTITMVYALPTGTALRVDYKK